MSNNTNLIGPASATSNELGKTFLPTDKSLPPLPPGSGGARRDRTDDLLNANQALSQLSYGP